MRSAVVSALAFALAAICPASAEDFRWSGPLPARASTEAGTALKEADVARLRTTLNLTPAQQPHWGPVEAALMDIARQDGRAETTGLVKRTSAAATRAMQLRRLKALAMPLIQTLDDNQRRDAIAFARRIGYGHLVAASF